MSSASPNSEQPFLGLQDSTVLLPVPEPEIECESHTPMPASDRPASRLQASARTEPAVAGDRLIRLLLANLLDQVPRAAMVGLSILGVDGQGSNGQHAQYRVTSRARQGRRSDALMQRVPALPDRRVVQASLRVGECTVLRVTDIPPRSPTHVLVCPSTTPAGDLIGAVFIVFVNGRRAPRGAERRRLNSAALRIGSQVAAVLDLVGQGPQRRHT